MKASGFENEHQRRLEQGLAILGVDMAKKRENEACGVERRDSDSEGDEGGNDSHQEALAGVAAVAGILLLLFIVVVVVEEEVVEMGGTVS